MTVAINQEASQKGMLEIKITGVASAANAGIGEILNPEGVTLVILRAFLVADTGSTGAANLDVGVGASGAKTTDILSTFDMIEATIGGKVFYGPAAQVAETEVPTIVWIPTEYITFTGSATSVGLAAKLYVEYLRVPSLD